MATSLFGNFLDNPSARYSLYHIWKIYSLIAEEGPLGRQELAEAVGLGQGTVRTILDKMKDDGSIDCTRAGVFLTDQGIRRLDSLRFEIKPVDAGKLTVGECDCAVVAKGMASHVKDGCEQRDEAVKAGAVGATTFVKKAGKIILLGDDTIPVGALAE